MLGSRIGSVILAFTTFIVILGTAVSVRADFNTATGQWEGDVSARNFSEYCRDELSDKRKTTFYAHLKKAEKALVAKQENIARTALLNAWRSVHRGGAEDDTSIKCFGKPVAQRWLKAQLSLQRLAQKPGLYITAADRGSDGLVKVISKQPAKRFARSIQRIKEVSNKAESNRKFGAFILPKEEAIAKACRDAMKPLSKQAKHEHQSTLVAENKAFNRPATRQEREAMDSISGAEALASSIAGVKLNTAVQQETLLVKQRVRDSRKLLREARFWNIEHYKNTQARPSAKRARKRGDTMLKKASNTKLSLGSRDKFYQDAINYYDFGGWKKLITKAKSAKNSILASLKA
jgi:hypothetical protein